MMWSKSLRSLLQIGMLLAGEELQEGKLFKVSSAGATGDGLGSDSEGQSKSESYIEVSISSKMSSMAKSFK